MGTKIDELMNDVSSNSLSQDENSMVDSIINDINGDSKQPSQHQMPQLSEEERRMLIQQQQQEQQMYEQQMRMQQQQQHQQQMQMQMQQQQQMQQDMQTEQQMQQKMSEVSKEPEKKLEKNIIYEILNRSKETIIVFLIYLFFNLNVVQNMTTIKTNSLFFDNQSGEQTFLMIALKSIVVASIFFAIQSILTK